MKLWRFASLGDGHFANAVRRGAWSRSADACTLCRTSRTLRVSPLVIEWSPGSVWIGDFTLTGFDSDVLATDAALSELAPYGGFGPGAVEMTEPTDLTAEQLALPRVPLPYRGPPVHEMWVEHLVNLEPERSTVKIEAPCRACGSVKRTAVGVERRESKWDTTSHRLIQRQIAREPGKGLFVRASDVGASGIFRVREFPAWVLATDVVREHIAARRLTNVAFMEVGDVVADGVNSRQLT